MKSLFEQFSGTYRKESDYTIPNLKMLEADDMKIGFMDNGIYNSCSNIVEQFILVFLQAEI